MKTCTKCKTEKPFTEFSTDKQKKDNFCSRCKACASAYRHKNRERIAKCQSDYYAANRDRLDALNAIYYEKYKAEKAEYISARSAKYYAKNKGRISAKRAKHHAANREQILTRSAKYYAANRERISERIARYQSENPEKCASRRRNRRARERNAKGAHTAADVIRIFEHQRGLCANCHAKLFRSGKQKFHVDHIVPLAKGGSNWPSNLQCLCPACNLSKHAKDPIAWAQENGRLL